METKICSKCGEEKELERLHRKRTELDGRRAWCKVCVSDCNRAYRESNRMRISAQKKEYYENNKKACIKKSRETAQTLEGKASHKLATQKYHRRCPKRHRAHGAVSCALRDGELTRPGHCSLCNCECKPEAHHHDYSQPLNVTWLCVSCHNEEHKRIREFAKRC